MDIELHRHDLPDGLDLGNVIAVDTETMGLNLMRDRLCLVQLSAGDGVTRKTYTISVERFGPGVYGEAGTAICMSI